MALFKLDRVSEEIDSKTCSIGIFIDLQAFDTLSHEILINIFNPCGFRGTVNYWIRSYLENSFPFVPINCIKSTILLKLAEVYSC